jgi:hypothetical protein
MRSVDQKRALSAVEHIIDEIPARRCGVPAQPQKWVSHFHRTFRSGEN